MPRNPVYALFYSEPGLAPTILRAGLASVFLFHGGQKSFGWFGGDGFEQSLRLLTDSSTFGIPGLLAATAIILEMAIVPLLAFGFFTRLAALAGAGIATGALVFIHRSAPFQDMELSLLVLASCLALMILGGGFLSLDRRLSRHFLPEIGSFY